MKEKPSRIQNHSGALQSDYSAGDSAVEDFKALVLRAIAQLSRRRPVFHSEADFQQEFARELYMLAPDLNIRLELPVRIEEAGTFNVDIMINRDGHWFAIELKYTTASLTTTLSNEVFSLKAQSAQDARRYDIVKDIWRLEQLVRFGRAEAGASITITNDTGLWAAPRALNPLDAAFRMHDGAILEGSLAWNDRASMGTRKGREGVLNLTGSYNPRWTDYSQIDVKHNGKFRQLVLFVW